MQELKKENLQLKHNYDAIKQCFINMDETASQAIKEKWQLYNENLKLKEENKELKDENSHKSNLIWYIYNCSKVETIQRLLYEYYECINDDRYNEKRVKKFWDDVFHLQRRKKYKSKYKQALKEIKEIIEFRFKTAYMTLGLKETDKIIEDIEKIVSEVLNEDRKRNQKNNTKI